ncbi:right-handed parallel beta-helix repeat-containing protein [Pseudanabaena mucicola]|uniref:Right-handed parallel beta-helix repeat-containing protein n=1 Tax=Pseudanabaena mucicola FACHB-723 TaxID=2692860 RepID=A0ABR7ZSJ3_9CYAN|nr:right-handed parallel beta-helix repeat-containing protein [Pseudanabaena mucicola]MBD2186933.1 right-handed parallel beta-helix repeat-containing protein [Pseudanabaena mucicola FACHB-723]
MRKLSVSEIFKPCCLSLVCINLGIAPAALSQTNPFPLDAQLRYNGGGAGIDGNTSVGLRIPLNQTPDNFLYVTPQIRVFNNGKIGSNLIVGYRSLDEAAKHILGGYVAYDNRDTGALFFQQISAGLEFFAETFDLRLNAYMPVGQSTVQLGETLLGTGKFIGNQFGIDRDRRIDAALGGVDVEAGTTLNITGLDGYLRPYAGTYFYTAANSTGALGIRGGLGYYGSLINAGISVQNDRVFGTSILFNIGVNIGNRPSSKPPTLLERMNESVVRNGSVMIENQTVRDQLIVINPLTGQPYSFFIVADNTTGLLGNPNVVSYANFTDAVANAEALGSDGIVFAYAPAGFPAPTAGGFTIPDQVQVISSAASMINLPSLVGGNFLTSLPLPSDTGVFPIITDTVTLATGGTNQALIGFAINKDVATGANAGIIGNNNVNATIANNIVTITAPSSTGVGTSGRGIVLVGASGNTNILNNQVSNAIAEGIRLDNVSGTAVISGNTVVNTIQPDTQTNVEAGILVRNNTGNADLTIANNIVRDNTATAGVVEIDGIEFSLCRVYADLPACTAAANAIVNITGNTIQNITGANDGADGIDINLGNFANATINITNNTLDNIVNKGISFGAVDGSVGTTTIANNQISNVGGAAIQVRVGETANGGQSSVRAAVQNNTLTNTETGSADDAAIILRSQNTATLCVRFEGNTLDNPTSSLDYLFRRQSSAPSGLQLEGLSMEIAVGTSNTVLLDELAARGNIGGAVGKYRVQNNSVQVPTADCTFP